MLAFCRVFLCVFIFCEYASADSVSSENEVVANEKIAELSENISKMESKADSVPSNNTFSSISPSPLALWVSVSLATISLIVNALMSIYIFRRDIFEKKQDRERSINDDYWFRTIIMPIILEPIAEFTDIYSNKILGIEERNNVENADEYKNYLDEFQHGLQIIISRCSLLKLYEDSLYETITSYFELLEDNVALHCLRKSEKLTSIKTTGSGSDLFFDCLRDVIGAIKVRHNKVTGT
jgi:hypothetical protein